MRFTIRPGDDPIAGADSTLLSAMGLPGGGIVKIGKTHCLVRAADTPAPTALTLGPRSMTNAGVKDGDIIDVKRTMLPQAQRVVVAGDGVPLESRHLSRALQGIPVTEGDVVAVSATYGEATEPEAIELRIVAVEPDHAGMVGNATVVAAAGAAREEVVAHPTGRTGGEPPSTADALLAGLDTELEILTGWLSLLTSPSNLPAAWGLPRVSGILLEGPAGCGKSELVNAAAAAAGASVHEASLDLVFKPERLLDVLEKAVKTTPTPGVVFIDRLDAVAGDEAMFRTQVAAILRWFLDAVAERPHLACVLGTSSVAQLSPGIEDSPLLPRTLSIPPPDAARRRLLFEAALARVPSDEIDFDMLAARTAGFSGADIVASVVHASALVAPSGANVTSDLLIRAVEDTTPSLGTVSLGEIPSYGFERVANLTEVKQRLTEAVIWPMTDPDRFSRLGIDPPRGLLLHGPPGTGKTFVIRALAHESGAAFFSVKGAELLDKYVGESERGVREVFARARAAAPSIIFFDEIDALAPVRGRSTNTVTDSVVAAMLTELDGTAERGDVVVIGATNRKDLVDSALLRPGRLEVHLELGLPAPEARRALLDITDVPFAESVDLDDVIAGTEGYSFAELSGMLREAALHALRRDATAIAVTPEDLAAAMANYANR